MDSCCIHCLLMDPFDVAEKKDDCFITGVLPIEDNPEVELLTSDDTPAPALPPRRATLGDNEGAPPVPPHQPPIADNERAPPIPPHQLQIGDNERAPSIPPHQLQIGDNEGAPPIPRHRYILISKWAGKVLAREQLKEWFDRAPVTHSLPKHHSIHIRHTL